MSLETQIQFSERYHLNRHKVFGMYGINYRDSSYNCHHIVTKNDLKTGVVGPNFDLNNPSNLYPIRRELHTLLHQIIEAADNGYDITYYVKEWQDLEVRFKTKNTTDYNSSPEVSKPVKKKKATQIFYEKISQRPKKEKTKNEKHRKHHKPIYRPRYLLQEIDQKQELSDFISGRLNLAKI
jgi:hypothetical protein